MTQAEEGLQPWNGETNRQVGNPSMEVQMSQNTEGGKGRRTLEKTSSGKVFAGREKNSQ